jgi:hypothetical protein
MRSYKMQSGGQLLTPTASAPARSKLSDLMRWSSAAVLAPSQRWNVILQLQRLVGNARVVSFLDAQRGGNANNANGDALSISQPGPGQAAAVRRAWLDLACACGGTGGSCQARAEEHGRLPGAALPTGDSREAVQRAECGLERFEVRRSAGIGVRGRRQAGSMFRKSGSAQAWRYWRRGDKGAAGARRSRL